MADNSSTTKLIDDQAAGAQPTGTVGSSSIKIVKESGAPPSSADLRKLHQQLADSVIKTADLTRTQEERVAQPLPPPLSVVDPAVAALLAKKEALQQFKSPPKPPTKFTTPLPVFVLRKKLEVPKQGGAPREVKHPEALQVQDLEQLVQLNAQVEAGVVSTPPGLSLEMQLFLEIARRVDLFQRPTPAA